MRNESEKPLKWRKYELLVLFGLLPEWELKGNIRRFKVQQSREIGQTLGDLLCEQPDGEVLYVVKLVPRNRGGQLPNLRISSRRDLASLPEFVAGAASRGFVEIWYCRTAVGKNIFSVAGRVSYDEARSERCHVVEQVWGQSPRLLESIKSLSSERYIRASRRGWGWQYEIEALSGIANQRAKVELEADFRRVAANLERRRSRVRVFLEFLQSKGVTSISLEFKMVGSEFMIIDWDTEADKRVFQ